jgi:O-antigen/teichoic acid export membrane protein
MLADYFNLIREWFLSLGENYGVNPLIFGSIYVGAIPFFTLSIGWLVKNYRAKKPIVLPVLSAAFFFVSAYLYLLIAGKNVPGWVYLLIILMVVFGAYSTVKKVRKRIEDAPNMEKD